MDRWEEMWEENQELDDPLSDRRLAMFEETFKALFNAANNLDSVKQNKQPDYDALEWLALDYTPAQDDAWTIDFWYADGESFVQGYCDSFSDAVARMLSYSTK